MKSVMTDYQNLLANTELQPNRHKMTLNYLLKLDFFESLFSTMNQTEKYKDDLFILFVSSLDAVYNKYNQIYVFRKFTYTSFNQRKSGKTFSDKLQEVLTWIYFRVNTQITIYEYFAVICNSLIGVLCSISQQNLNTPYDFFTTYLLPNNIQKQYFDTIIKETRQIFFKDDLLNWKLFQSKGLQWVLSTIGLLKEPYKRLLNAN